MHTRDLTSGSLTTFNNSWWSTRSQFQKNVIIGALVVGIIMVLGAAIAWALIPDTIKDWANNHTIFFCSSIGGGILVYALAITLLYRKACKEKETQDYLDKGHKDHDQMVRSASRSELDGASTGRHPSDADRWYDWTIDDD